MSFGKIVRKIVKKWLRKENEESGVVVGGGPGNIELFAESAGIRLGSSDGFHQHCVFCERDDAARRRDLNRNVHISSSSSSLDEMGFSRDEASDYSRWVDDDDDAEHRHRHRRAPDGSFYSSSPRHGATPPAFVDSDSVEFVSDAAGATAACDASRLPVPVCVCEACYIFVSSNLPSAISAKSRTAAGAGGAVGPAGGAAVAAGQPLSYSSKTFLDRLVRSGATTTSSGAESDPAGCNKDRLSVLPTSNRQIHSASSEKSGYHTERLETICRRRNSSSSNPEEEEGEEAALPVSVRPSLDGEEGYAESQRRLRARNRWHDPVGQPRIFRPPPNKTICHVPK